MIREMCRAERIIDDAKMQEAFRGGAVDLVLDHPAARARLPEETWAELLTDLSP